MRRFIQLAQPKALTYSWSSNNRGSLQCRNASKHIPELQIRSVINLINQDTTLRSKDLLGTPLQGRCPSSLSSHEIINLKAWYCRKLIASKSGAPEVFNALATFIEQGAEVIWPDLDEIPLQGGNVPFELHQSKETNPPIDNQTKTVLVSELREKAKSLKPKKKL